MSENSTENTEVEETYEADESGVAYSSETAPSADSELRPATIAPAAATGRRKQAVARVRLVPGTGQWRVNGRTLDSYFPNKLHQQVVNEPFVATHLEGRFDVIARIHGGGITGQAGALRLGVARAPQRDRHRGQPRGAEEGRAADPRLARHRAQEGRSEEGPEGASVQQALIADGAVWRGSSAPTGSAGLANESLTAELALDLSVSAAHVLADRGDLGPPIGQGGHRPFAVVGRDPRISGQFLEAAVVAGLASAGVDVLLLGVLPTPGVAYLTDTLGADLGVMISASHNADARQRHQVPRPRRTQARRRRRGRDRAAAPRDLDATHAAAPSARVRPHPTAVEEYAAHLVRSIDHPLAGLKVVVDCAEGAASAVGPQALTDAGAEVVAIHASPDGININDGCGSTHLEPLRRAVVEHGAHVGFALDGDADRCLAVDADGEVVDGDQILAILALAMKERGRLAKDTVVATVMSNLGFVQAMRAHGVGVRQTKVGDRYVLEAMVVSGYTLGGEQSGHVIMSDHATTGDGILTALHVLERMVTTGRSLADAGRGDDPAAAGAGQRARRRQGPHRRGRRPGRRRGRGGGRPRRTGPDPAPPVRHRAVGAGDGRGAHRGRGPRRSRTGWPRSSAPGWRCNRVAARAGRVRRLPARGHPGDRQARRGCAPRVVGLRARDRAGAARTTSGRRGCSAGSPCRDRTRSSR